MKITKVKISELKQAEYNPRRMTNKQYEDLKNSLEKFGLIDPIIINSDNTVIGGHQRLKIVRELGASEVPTVRVNLSKEDERELNIRLNKNTGEWNWDMLANEWDNVELKNWGLDVWQPEESVSNETDYSMNTADEKLKRFLDAKVKNITIPFETEEFTNVVGRLEKLLLKYNCQDYRALIYKILENEKV